MRLDRPFVKLPLRFSADELEREVTALPGSAWTAHPSGFAGNEAVRLVTPEGEDTDALEGPMAPTPHLQRCPYMMEVMAELGAVWGRSRLMALGPGADVPFHVDINYYWRTHLRIHIPVITNPDVTFTCGGETIHMQAGECWVLDTFRSHGVVNGGKERRVHLVLDTVGGERLWDLIHLGDNGGAPSGDAPMLQPGSRRGDPLVFEQVNKPKVMSPWEVRCHVGELIGQMNPDPALYAVASRLDRFIAGWSSAWAQFGTADEGLPLYAELIRGTREDLRRLGADDLMLPNGRALAFVLDAMLFANAIDRPRREQQQTGQPKSVGVRRLAS